MHIPDGFINAGVSAAAGVVAAGGIGYSLTKRRRRSRSGRRRWPGWSPRSSSPCRCSTSRSPAAPAATCSAARSRRCWSAPGSARCASRSCCVVQALLFADGGLTALGLNVAQHGAVTAFGGYADLPGAAAAAAGAPRSASSLASGIAAGASVRARVARRSRSSTRSAARASASVGTVAAAMVGVHVLIGIGEGLITALTVAPCSRVRPDLVYGARDLRPDARARDRRGRCGTMASTRSACALAAFIARRPARRARRWPSSSARTRAAQPDGLNKVADRQGLRRRRQQRSTRSTTARSPATGSRASTTSV